MVAALLALSLDERSYYVLSLKYPPTDPDSTHYDDEELVNFECHETWRLSLWLPCVLYSSPSRLLFPNPQATLLEARNELTHIRRFRFSPKNSIPYMA
jgi:hypothetical protein